MNRTEVVDELRENGTLGQHQVLHDEFQVHHASAVVLHVKEIGAVRVPVEHFSAHLDDVLCHLCGIALKREDVAAFILKLLPHLRVARAETGARERLMLPRPGSVSVGVALILAEHFNVGSNQPILSVGTKAHVNIKQNARTRLQREPAQHALDELHVVALRLRRIVVV